MISRERCRIAMSGGIPDRVPVIPQINHTHAIRALGLDFRKTVVKVLKQPFLRNKLILECARRYGVDGVRFFIPADPVENLVDDGTCVWQISPGNGTKIGKVDFEGGGWVIPLIERPLIKNEQDIKKIPVIPAESLIATPKFQALKKMIRSACKDLFVIGVPGYFTVEHVATLIGKEQMLIDLIERPDFVKEIIRKSTDRTIQAAIALATLGVDAVLIGETFGGLIGPAHFEEFCSPAIKRFVNALKPYNVLTYLHICGNSTALFELMADTGVDCIEPLDPLGGVRVRDAKARVGKRVALMGGVNTITLAKGTPQQVKEDCLRCLREGAPGGGYILACGDMLPTETPAENVRVMIEAARNYRYE
jgi:MtaA/CmuA family methyltransferase